MKNIISSEEKKRFLLYFMHNHSLPALQISWILNYIYAKQSLINSVVFTNKVDRTAFGLKIFSTNAPNGGFFCLYYKNKEIRDPKQAYSIIKEIRDETLHIEIDFDGKETCSKWNSILGKNHNYAAPNTTTFSHELEEFLHTIISHTTKELLMKEIDKTLINKDYQSFLQLSSQYKNLTQQKK